LNGRYTNGKNWPAQRGSEQVFQQINRDGKTAYDMMYARHITAFYGWTRKQR